MNHSTLFDILDAIIGPLVVGLVVGAVLFRLGQSDIEKRTKNSAIRGLMTYRGDYSSPDFRRALNKVSITFHDDEETRKQIRDLYEIINNPASQAASVNRKIVGVIYYLCHNNGFAGITEYDIDQSFPETKQVPNPTQEEGSPPISSMANKDGKKSEEHKTKGDEGV